MGLMPGVLLQPGSDWSEKGLSTSGRAWPAHSLLPGPSVQAVTKEASARGDLKPLQIPHPRKSHCWAELCVLLQNTQVPRSQQKAGDAHKAQHPRDLPPGLAAMGLGESLHPSCLRLPLTMKSVAIDGLYSQTETFSACLSVILRSVNRF